MHMFQLLLSSAVLLIVIVNENSDFLLTEMFVYVQVYSLTETHNSAQQWRQRSCWSETLAYFQRPRDVQRSFEEGAYDAGEINSSREKAQRNECEYDRSQRRRWRVWHSDRDVAAIADKCSVGNFTATAATRC